MDWTTVLVGAERPLRKKTGANLLGVSEPTRDVRRGGAAVQLAAHPEAIDAQRRLRGGVGQHGAEPHRRRPPAHREPNLRADKLAGVYGDGTGVHLLRSRHDASRIKPVACTLIVECFNLSRPSVKKNKNKKRAFTSVEANLNS